LRKITTSGEQTKAENAALKLYTTVI